MKPQLEPLTPRLQRLPVDDRGYPVPWFVEWVDGKPEFRAMSQQKFIRAVKEKLCWVCGEKLGRHMTFLAGPMCGINRTSSEPPGHRDCALWSARNCPFLANPRMVRREDETINNEALREAAAGFAITRNPGVAMLWTTRQYELFRDMKDRYLFDMGVPESVEWYAEGRLATRDEVLHAIETGLPSLEAMARMEKGGMEHLAECRQRLERWLP